MVRGDGVDAKVESENRQGREEEEAEIDGKNPRYLGFVLGLITSSL